MTRHTTQHTTRQGRKQTYLGEVQCVAARREQSPGGPDVGEDMFRLDGFPCVSIMCFDVSLRFDRMIDCRIQIIEG
uniref:Uncharacterized protein n=1 Tax=Candidatus Kentrum sp. LFY TaxID=2126342 RepID=A0A450U4T1_9GAMM|nr:MAG: hypothetical protein BECKLFY1418B_GA0070995_100138 [Candidatus Kentron sp. LFY]VFJ99071.1 MAG: hypothetical protein BECKLFY1418A_GA0070994_10938 [Candidatus Kentron sp. LFY]